MELADISQFLRSAQKWGSGTVFKSGQTPPPQAKDRGGALGLGMIEVYPLTAVVFKDFQLSNFKKHLVCGMGGSHLPGAEVG